MAVRDGPSRPYGLKASMTHGRMQKSSFLRFHFCRGIFMTTEGTCYVHCPFLFLLQLPRKSCLSVCTGDPSGCNLVYSGSTVSTSLRWTDSYNMLATVYIRTTGSTVKLSREIKSPTQRRLLPDTYINKST